MDLAQLAAEMTHFLLNDEIQIHPLWAETVTIERLQSYIEKYQFLLEDSAMRHVFYLEMRKHDDYMTSQLTYDYNNIVDTMIGDDTTRLNFSKLGDDSMVKTRKL